MDLKLCSFVGCDNPARKGQAYCNDHHASVMRALRKRESETAFIRIPKGYTMKLDHVEIDHDEERKVVTIRSVKA